MTMRHREQAAQEGAVGNNDRLWKRYLAKGDPDGAVWSPGMADVPLRNHNWFWKPGEERTVRSVNALMGMYGSSVGHNCNLLIGEVITPEGLVPFLYFLLIHDGAIRIGCQRRTR